MTAIPYRLDASRPIRGERLIAAGRITLAAVAVFALWVDPTTPSQYARPTFGILVGYLAFALILGALTAFWIRWLPARTALITHVIDGIVFATLTYLSGGASSLFFVFFTFSMAAATVRWQWSGALRTAAGFIIALAAMSAFQMGVVEDPHFELNRFIVRVAYLLVIAVILGYLGDFERRRRGEIAALAAWSRRASGDLTKLLGENLRQSVELLHVHRAVLVWEDPDEPWLEIAEWAKDSLRTWREAPDAFAGVVAEEVVLSDFHVENARAERSIVVRSTGGLRDRWTGVPINREFAERFDLRHVLGFRVSGEIIRGHLFLAGTSATTADDLSLGTIAAQRVADALDMYMLGRHLSEMAVLEERQRLSHELHDGVLQSLAGIALQLRRAQQLVPTDPNTVVSALEEAQRQLAEEQRDIRFAVQGLRKYASSSGADFETRLKELVERVETVWGVHVTTSVKLDDTALTTTQEHQLFRITQEAVVNAARHGGADEVRVDFSRQNGALHMAVVDNGRGFPFEGRHDAVSMAEGHIGPVTLKARVKSLGGEMVIDSTPHGATIEVTVPLEERR